MDRSTIRKRAPEELRLEKIGARLAAIRLAHDLRQSDMADLLGVKPNYWSRWETGSRMIPVDKAYELTVNFAIDLDYIFTGDLRALPVDLRTLLQSATNQGACAGQL